MGSLIPNGNDAEVINKLNDRFQGNKLINLRRHIKGKSDDFFASDRHLHRISYRLNIFPSTGNRPKGRWYLFLRDLIGDTNRTKILAALKGALDDEKCVGVHFWARFNPKTNPPDYDVDISPKHPDANGEYWITITLLCDHEIDAGISGDPSVPPADNGEKSPVQPSPLRWRGKSPKRALKKAAKKAVSKVGKKPAKKRK
jgi:hypothetical protein